MAINEQLAELEEQLKTQNSKITKLKENVKWLYKYGGSGTGSGGGGGNTSTKTPTLVYQSSTGQITAELGTSTSNTYITTEGTQNLGFYLRYLNIEHTYKVSYSTNAGVSWSSITVSSDNDFTIPLAITKNMEIRIRLKDTTDNSDGPATIILSFITNPVTVVSYLKGYTDNGEGAVQDEIFMQNYNKISVVMDITPHITGSFKVSSLNESISEYTVDQVEMDKTYTKEWVLYDKTFLNDLSNVGAYSLKLTTEFNGDLSGIQTSEFEHSYTLIPNSIYVIIKAEGGSVYSTKPDSGYYEFSAGSISFTGYVYKGSNDGESFQVVTTKIYDDQRNELHTFDINPPVSERSNFLSGTTGVYYFNNDSIKSNEGNWFEIETTVAQVNGDTPQVQSYYIFVKKNENVLNWYPSSFEREWYFNKENKSNIEGISNSTSELSCQLSIAAKSYSWTNDLSVNSPESHIAIAINAEEGNDDLLLVTLKTKSSSNIEIYQNKIVLAQYGDIESYIPMDNTYHLLELYGRIVKVSGNTLYYEWIAYIDGIIEGGLSSYTTANISLQGMTLNPNENATFKINHFNYTVFNCNVYKRWDKGYIGMNDSNIVEYYYKYLCITNSSYSEGNYSTGVQAFNKIGYTYDDTTNIQDQLTKLTAAEVADLQTYGGIPVLLFQVDNENLNNIMYLMKNSFTEEEATNAVDLQGIKYFKANNTESEVCDDQGLASYKFQIEIQGSSTKGYKFKNWELSIATNQEQETIPIFSLNYGETDEDGKDVGFFPEQSFTLKGDIVDSAHSVNTSIGDFVNDNCTQFNYGYRNCLSGKPILVLVEYVPSDASASEFYYFGIYNYNLGRKSKYNLYYANRPNSVSSKDKGFIIRTTESVAIKDSYASAEIANNSPFWDFSQYDDSILFENKYKMEDGSDPTPEFLQAHEDTYYMWGDLVYKQGYDINKAVGDCVKSVSRAGGFLFGPNFLNKEFDSSSYFTELTASSTYNAWKVINAVPDSIHKYVRKVKYNTTSNTYNYIFDASETKEDEYIEQDLINCIYGEYNEDGIIVKQPYINYDSVMEYYVIMQAFGLVDSPMKNLNLKTWNGTTFYAAFYDMDTGLGGDNAGGLTITPFAFSDYWETDDQGEVTRHLDYWPNNSAEQGFDVPSSFLFAIGKYAAYYQQTHQSIGDKLLTPMEYWAKLRQSDGPLRNASYFVEKYFSKKFATTHPMIWNMNYRSKYLIQSFESNEFDSVQFGKFHGRRINRIKAWLNDRLHMLDAYFNINNLNYSAENNSNVSLSVNGTPQYTTNLQQNSDVILLQNIFTSSGSDSIKTSGNVSCEVETLNYSPFIAKTSTNTGAIRLFNKGKKYNIYITVASNQAVFPYGCSRWTYINNVNSFIFNGLLFYLKNDYLTNLVCNKEYTSAFSPSGWELHTPKMQKIEITGSTFSGPLNIYPGTALTDLDLSNTSITFETRDSGDYNVCPNLQNLILNNFKGSLKLTNCNLLSNIEMNNATLNSLTINPYQGNCHYKNTSIKSLNIVGSGNSTFVLENDTTITNLTLQGFKSVIVTGCTKLKTVSLEGTELPKYISITSAPNGLNFDKQNKDGVVTFQGVETLILQYCTLENITEIKCDNTLTSLDLTNTTCKNATLNLTQCSNISKLSVSNTNMATANLSTITLNSDVPFKHSYFQKVTGTIIVDSNEGYALSENGNLTSIGNVILSANVTNASYLFYNSGIKSIDSLQIKNKLTNIAGMFQGTAITNTSQIAKALANSASTVTNMTKCFSNSAVTDFSDFLNLEWSGITSESAMIGACNTGVNITTSIKSNQLYFPGATSVDPLCIFQGTNEYGTNNSDILISFDADALNKVESTSLNFKQIIVKDISNTDFLTKAANCTSVQNLEFVKNTSLDFRTNTHITTFNNFIQSNTVTATSVNNFFKVCSSISNSLNALQLSDALDIMNFVDYSLMTQNTSLFSSDFSISKTITQDDFQTLINTIFGNNKLTSIQGVFKNCTIICDESVIIPQILDVSIPANSKVTDISSLFECCHAFYIDEAETRNRIYLNFKSENSIGFSNLSALKNCISTWADCYIYKLASTWFADVKNILANCSNAFKYTQFKQCFSDDVSTKIAYNISSNIYIGNQSTNSQELNVTVDKNNYIYNNNYIIPEKFFYFQDSEGNLVNKTSQVFNANEIFCKSTLFGLLPDKLFATNSRPTSNCSNMFRYCSIIPYYVKSLYQTLIPSTWDGFTDDEKKAMIPYITYKINIYCITPNGTEDTPYLTGAIDTTINGAIIVPTIHEIRNNSVDLDTIWQYLNTVKYQDGDVITSQVSLTNQIQESQADDAVFIGDIDFIYQYNEHSLDKTSNNLRYALPNSIGIYQSYINKRESLNPSLNPNISEWDWGIEDNYGLYSSSNYKLAWAYNYQPSSDSIVYNDKTLSIPKSDELYKIHYGIQYNGGENVLVVDDTNTDGLNPTNNTNIDALGLIGDKAALLLYGPIFHKDLKVISNILDSRNTENSNYPSIFSRLAVFTESSYGSLGGTSTNNSAASGYRYYKPSSDLIYYAYDISRNLYLPNTSKNNQPITYIVFGRKWTSQVQEGQKTYTVYRYFNKRGDAKYTNYMREYQ